MSKPTQPYSVTRLIMKKMKTNNLYSRSDVWHDIFFAQLVRSGGNVTSACIRARVKDGIVYKRRKEDPHFAMRWRKALRAARDTVDAEIFRRAHDGVSEPVFHNGKIVSKVRKYSDTLLMFYAKGLMPEKYRDNYTVQHKGHLTSTNNHNYDFSGIDTETLLKLEEARRSGTERISEPGRN